MYFIKNVEKLKDFLKEGFNPDMQSMKVLVSMLSLDSTVPDTGIPVEAAFILRDSSKYNIGVANKIDDLQGYNFLNNVPLSSDNKYNNIIHNLTGDILNYYKNLLKFNDIEVDPQSSYIPSVTNIVPTGVYYSKNNKIILIYSLVITDEELFSKLKSSKYSMDSVVNNIGTIYEIPLEPISKAILKILYKDYKVKHNIEGDK